MNARQSLYGRSEMQSVRYCFTSDHPSVPSYRLLRLKFFLTPADNFL